MINFLQLFFLFLLLILFAWITTRVLKLKKPIFKWTGTIMAGILAVVLAIIFVAAIVGYQKLTRSYDNPVSSLKVDYTPERIARGKKFEPLCAGCHAPDSSAWLVGRNFLGDDAPPIGEFYAPNLTPVHLADWSDGEIIRAIREGVHRSGRSLLIMPSDFLCHLSDYDVESVIAYLRSLPPEGSETPPNRLNVLGAIMLLKAPIFSRQPPITEPIISPPVGPTSAYGAYLSSFTCGPCHGSDLLGDPNLPSPPLISIPELWSDQAFIAFIRSGIKPDGSIVDGEAMPWQDLSQIFSDDDELCAIYAYLQEKGAGYFK